MLLLLSENNASISSGFFLLSFCPISTLKSEDIFKSLTSLKKGKKENRTGTYRPADRSEAPTQCQAAAGIYLTDWKDKPCPRPHGRRRGSLRDPRGKLIFKYKPAGNGPFFPLTKRSNYSYIYWHFESIIFFKKKSIGSIWLTLS